MRSGYTGDIADDPQATLNGYERNCLFHHRADGRFVDVAHLAGADLVDDGRALGVADFDQDGDLDLVVQNYRQPTRLLIQEGKPGGAGEGDNWLEVELTGTRSNRDAVGARVRILHGAEGAPARPRVQVREVACGAGYLAQQSFVLHFGLGDDRTVDRIEVLWPSGARQELRSVAANQRLSIVEPLGDRTSGGEVARREP